MSRILKISLLVFAVGMSAGFAVGRLSQDSSANAQDTDRRSKQEVNVPITLPDTGQTSCYDEYGEVINCTSTGQDGAYATGCPPNDRFVDNGDGTVTDHCTGLMWQKKTADINGDGKISSYQKPKRRPARISVLAEDMTTWKQALEYCDNLEFAGYDDWRLPNIRELESILDYGRAAPAIDPIFDTAPVEKREIRAAPSLARELENIPEEVRKRIPKGSLKDSLRPQAMLSPPAYWSSTTSFYWRSMSLEKGSSEDKDRAADAAWVVRFYMPWVNWESKIRLGGYVRAVRGG